MSTLLVWREQLQIIYSKYSVYITIAIKFIFGMIVFGLINSNIGFMKAASSMACTFGLAVVCAFLPMIVMVMAATALILLHFYSLSLAVAVITTVYFLLMYIFYFRFSAGKSWLILLTAAAFAFKIPVAAVVAIGLLGTPACLVPAACGTFSYYIIRFVMTSTSTFKGEGMEELIQALTSYMKQSLNNKEMWVMTGVVMVSILLVYGIRTLSVDHAWKIAAAAGTAAAVVGSILGNVALNLHISYTMLIVSGVLAILLGLLLEATFLSVDYSRTERLEFEDDEYHYYVKAVPKLAVTAPEKNIKKISGRRETSGTDSRTRWAEAPRKERKAPQERPAEKNKREAEDADDILLTRSLSKELGMDTSVQKKIGGTDYK